MCKYPDLETYLALKRRGGFKRKDSVWAEKVEMIHCDSTYTKGLEATESLSVIYKAAVLHQVVRFLVFYLQDKAIYTTA